MFKDGGWVQDGPVEHLRIVWMHAEEEMATSSASSLCFVVVPGIGVDSELHVGGLVCQAGVGVGGAVV